MRTGILEDGYPGDGVYGCLGTVYMGPWHGVYGCLDEGYTMGWALAIPEGYYPVPTTHYPGYTLPYHPCSGTGIHGLGP